MSFQDLRDKLTDAVIAGDIPKIVMHMLTLALEMGSSDVHIEPGEKIVRNRFRIDGVLQSIIEYPKNIHSAVTSRVKIMSGLKIDEQRKPQDGRLQMTTENLKQIELRVSTLPTVNGEKICMRLQDKNKNIPSFAELGLRGNNLQAMVETIQNPNGITLVTGPTGSGKTTTLYSALDLLNKEDVNIITIEDPVEYEMKGLTQSQVKPTIGYDFSFGLRTALRQDPDIIMVGEIRDQETIEIAIRAALTGHMVLSTIHTNSAAATITRLLDMGVQPFKITSTLRTIEAQRLVRTICSHCKEEYTPDEIVQKDILTHLEKLYGDEELDRTLLHNMKLFRGQGCDECAGTGMQGRIAIYEVMRLNRELEQMILREAHTSEIEEAAIEQGMTTLLQDGYIKVLLGITIPEEIYKVANS